MKIPFLQVHIVKTVTLESIKAKATTEQRQTTDGQVSRLLFTNIHLRRALAMKKGGK